MAEETGKAASAVNSYMMELYRPITLAAIVGIASMMWTVSSQQEVMQRDITYLSGFGPKLDAAVAAQNAIAAQMNAFTALADEHGNRLNIHRNDIDGIEAHLDELAKTIYENTRRIREEENRSMRQDDRDWPPPLPEELKDRGRNGDHGSP
jgi:hypothetical protein